MKRCLILGLTFCLFFVCGGFSYGADFIAPNSSGEPIVVDISDLNVTSGLNVTIGEFTDQPRSYRNDDTKSLVIFPPALSSSEKTLQISAGGSSITKTISFRSSPAGELRNSLLPNLKKPVAGNAVCKISDGRIVLTGGSKSISKDALGFIQIFNPENGKTELARTPNELSNAGLKIPRANHTATYLGISETPIGMITGPVHQILVAGGFTEDGKILDSLEIIEIKAGTLQAVSTLLSGKNSKLKRARLFHSASLLPNGDVLIAGGQGKINTTNIGALGSVEIFDPILKEIKPAGFSLTTPRLLHTATILQDGNILITGGFTNQEQGNFGFGPATETSELINAKTLTIKNVGSFTQDERIGGHSATLLSNGFVLVVGGSSDFFSGVVAEKIRGLTTGKMQFYNPVSESFNPVIDKNTELSFSLTSPRFLHQTVLLPNGSIAVIGGLTVQPAVDFQALINTPQTAIEVFDVDLLNSSTNVLFISSNSVIEDSVGRISPTAVLVTPENKTHGFLKTTDAENFVNSAVFVTGGFTNGFGTLPTKVSELLQIESNQTVEGRKIKLNPEAAVKGSFVSELLISLDTFSKVPSLGADPQTVNLSISNDFKATLKVLTTSNETALLKAESSDLSGSIIVSPSLFQPGEEITVTRKDSGVNGEFEINIVAQDNSKEFIKAILKVNVQDSSKPFVGTIPGNGISLSSDAPANTEKVQLKVFSPDGKNELSSIPKTTKITAQIQDVQVANLGGDGVSSITGNLTTLFTVHAVKPGKTTLNFLIDNPDVLSVSIPVEVAGTPTFPSSPVASETLSSLLLNKVDFSSVQRLDNFSFSFSDLRILPDSLLFPLYVPVNLQSSVDNSNISGIFTLRPLFGLDLSTAKPRTLLNNNSTDFRTPLLVKHTALGGVFPASDSKGVALLASSDGLRLFSYSEGVNEPINKAPEIISKLSDVGDLKLLKSGSDIKAVGIMDSKLFVLNTEDNNLEINTNLSNEGFELRLTNFENEDAAVVSVGSSGVDLLFPLNSADPRRINFKLAGNTKHITQVPRLADASGPFVIAFDGINTISIVDLKDVEIPVKTINTNFEKITKLDYAGRFLVNGKLTDILVASGERKLLLYDLNNLTEIETDKSLHIKNVIEDLIVIDGIAYIAIGNEGIQAISIGSLLTSGDVEPLVGEFKKSKIVVIKPSGKLETKTKKLNALKLADSKPFLLSFGEDNDLTVIRVSP